MKKNFKMSDFTSKIGICGLILAFSLPVAAQTSKFTDKRDGKTYRTVKIGNKTWMAQNLNFTIRDSWCYDNDDSNCAKYGRLYTWDAAMRACPEGWRLPTQEDWNDLVRIAGGSSKGGIELKSKTGWDDDGNGTDDHGFSALPGGGRLDEDDFDDVGGNGYWWGATERGNVRDAYLRIMCSSDEYAKDAWINKRFGLSVRCFQGERP